MNPTATRVRAYRTEGRSSDSPFVLYTTAGAILEHKAHDVVVLKGVRCGVDEKHKPFVEGELVDLDVRFCFTYPTRVKQPDGVWKLGFRRALYNKNTSRFFWFDPLVDEPSPLFVADIGVLCPTGLYVMF